MADRTGSSVFWPKITSLVDGSLVTMELMYNQAIHRLQDNGVYLLGKIAAVYSDMASTAIGTRAQVVGNVDLTAFNYNGGITLSGLTLIFDEDTAAAQTVTFDNTVTTPAILLAQIVAQAATNLAHAFTNDGFLLSKSNTVGSGSTMATVTGTAAALVFGSQTVTSPGSGATANDGASKIGLGAFTSPSGWPGGTLRDFLQTLFTLVDAHGTDITNRVNKDGDDWNGPMVLATSDAAICYRNPTALSNTSSNVGPTSDVFTIPVFAGASVTYTLNRSTSPVPVGGQRLTILSKGLNDLVDGVFIASEGVGDVFKFTEGDKYGTVEFQFDPVADGGNGAWVVIGWSVDNDAYALLDPYP